MRHSGFMLATGGHRGGEHRHAIAAVRQQHARQPDLTFLSACTRELAVKASRCLPWRDMRTVNTGTMRGTRIGAEAPREPDRGIVAARVLVSYWCARKHETVPSFATGAVIPDVWVCRCGRPAGRDPGQVPPDPPAFRGEQKSHLDHVKERRSKADGEALITWALDRLRGRHGIHPTRRPVDVGVPGPAADAGVPGPAADAGGPGPAADAGGPGPAAAAGVPGPGGDAGAPGLAAGAGVPGRAADAGVPGPAADAGVDVRGPVMAATPPAVPGSVTGTAAPASPAVRNQPRRLSRAQRRQRGKRGAAAGPGTPTAYVRGCTTRSGHRSSPPPRRGPGGAGAAAGKARGFA